MKSRIAIILATTILSFYACSQNKPAGDSNSSMETITKTSLSVQEFNDALQKTGNAQLLDVRTPEEFSKGHLANAVNINWYDAGFKEQVKSLAANKPVFVYCLSGKRSGEAAAYLRSAGFGQVYEMSGGIMQWRAANLPETTEQGGSSNASLTPDQYQHLLSTDKLTLVDVYAEWCGPCKKMAPYLKEIEKDMAATVKVVRIDADAHPELMNALKVEVLPTLFLYDKNKKLIWQHTGYIDKAGVVKQL